MSRADGIRSNTLIHELSSEPTPISRTPPPRPARPDQLQLSITSLETWVREEFGHESWCASPAASLDQSVSTPSTKYSGSWSPASPRSTMSNFARSPSGANTLAPATGINVVSMKYMGRLYGESGSESAISEFGDLRMLELDAEGRYDVRLDQYF